MRFYRYLQERDMSMDQALLVFGLNQKALGQLTFIHKRYRDLIKKYHPDKPGGNADKMVLVNLAYEVLKKSTPQKQKKGFTVTGEKGRAKENLYKDLFKSGAFKGSKVNVKI